MTQGFSKDLLAGRVAVVTGGGTGIGRVTALELARHGAAVAVAARKLDRLEAVAQEIRDAGGKALAVACDISDAAQVKQAVAAVEEGLGPADILVNNAAANFVWPSDQLTSVRWRKVIDIVLNGTFHCTHAFGKRMLERGSGSIVSIIAAYAWTGGPGFAPSAAAKAGVLALTRTLGAEWARRGVRVNAIAPGPIDTPQTRERLWPTEEAARGLIERIPAGRFGTEEDVSNLVLFLSSPLAVNITGDCVTTDGGLWLGRGALDFAGGKEILKRGRS